MSNAIVLLYDCLSLLVKWFFSAEIVSGVSLGWVTVSLLVFSVLIGSIFSVPHSSTAYSVNSHDYSRSRKVRDKIKNS